MKELSTDIFIVTEMWLIVDVDCAPIIQDKSVLELIQL